MGLNGSGKFKYDKKSGASFYLSYGKLGPAFKIKKFINNYYGIDNYWLNCFDCAIIVSTFANLHGQISMQAKIRNPYGNDFECNQIISIGDVDTAWEVPFKQPDGKGYFSYHQIVFEKTLAVNLKDASTYDACLKVDGGEYPQQKNSVGKIALLPNDLLFSNNEKKEVSITEPYVDRTYRDRLVHNNSACWIHSILINWGFSFDMSDNIKNRYLEGYEAEQKMTDYFKELLSKIDVQEKTLTVFPIDLSFIKAWADQITVEHPDDRTALYRVKTDNLDIDIDYYLCKDIQSAHEQLYLMYNNIVSPKIISSVETNMKLGDIAFFSEENTSMILWSHSNIVIQILQNTTISADLFSIAKIINEQIEEKLRE